jgi:type IV pilus assembly protein PilV
MFLARRFSNARARRRSRARGASLIEVLVSVLLAAVGLLALSGANVASIRYSKMAQYRGTATMLAADLAERMRANPDGFTTSTDYDVDFDTQATAPAASTDCFDYSHTCTSAQLAAYDLVNWRLAVRNQLPGGSVYLAKSVSTSVKAADLYVAWRDPAVAAPDENSTDARNYGKECPASFSSDKSVRCIYFRINL